jgi:DNA polymerase III subunit gamma/tau
MFFQGVLKRYFEEGVQLPMGALLGGHSGVGKTTIARIIAASLNCPNRTGVEPCGECPNCKQIIEGVGGVMEIDASFFGSVENVRKLRERLSSYSFSDYEVVIIDECHMMSRESNNVLLKLFEEPPECVLFLLCTTEPNKLLDTVRSRLVEFRFTIIECYDVVTALQEILKKEGITCKPLLLEKLYKLSNNNFRDVIVSLETLALLGNTKITDEMLTETYGDVYFFDKLIDVLRKNEYPEAVALYDTFFVHQSDLKFFIDNLIGNFSDRLKTALLDGDEISSWYVHCLRTVYEFSRTRIGLLSGASVVRLLLLLLLPSEMGKRTFTGKVDTAFLKSAPTTLLSGDDMLSMLTEDKG